MKNQDTMRPEYNSRRRKVQRWIVDESDPRPDVYISVFVDDGSKKELENKAGFKVYKNESLALRQAQQLRKKYQAEYVRLFYTNGSSVRLR
jgi:hypothetical protein